MADSMLQNLLKTPRQIREEQLLKMRNEAAGRAQLGGPIRGASSALPGIFSSVLQQQRPALATDIAQTARGLTQGLGGMLGAAGYQQAGQALAQATVTPEERQAAQAQSVLRGVDMNDPAAVRDAANRLSALGLTGASTQLLNLAQQMELQSAKVKAERARELKFTAEKEKAERASPITEMIGKINPQDYYPESIEKFKKSGQFSDLERIDKPEADDRTELDKKFDRYTQLLADGKTELARKYGVGAGLIPEMSVALQKEHIDSMRTAMESRANSLRYNDLADDVIAAEEFKGGVGASWEEAYKEFTGNTDAVSLLKTRYRAIRASAAVNNLPPGAASDADVRLALSGVPPENANAETVAQFLRGLAKLEAEVAAYNTAKVAYLDANRELIGFDEAYQASRKRVETKQQTTTRTTAGGITYEVIE